MTYGDLQNYIQTLRPTQLEDDVTIFVRGIDEYYPASNISEVKNENDVLDQGHTYLIV